MLNTILLQMWLAWGMSIIGTLTVLFGGLLLFLIITLLVRYLGIKKAYIILVSLHLIICSFLFIYSHHFIFSFLIFLAGLTPLIITFISFFFLKPWKSFLVVSIVHTVVCIGILTFLFLIVQPTYKNSEQYIGLWRVKAEHREKLGYYIKRESNGDLILFDVQMNEIGKGEWRDYITTEDAYPMIEHKIGENWEEGFDENIVDSLLSK